ncbi:CBS domain-containing protein [Streptomyces sp. NPDC002012]|uniref:CBS domain-containing protein n=1 Tax=unclassified Streptomyces TaxID=2593676 RepID=UPI003329CF95
MEEHRTQRLPVIDEHRLVGVITEADLARNLPERQLGALRGVHLRGSLTVPDARRAA